MISREKLLPILEILLAKIAQEMDTTQEYISLEMEQTAYNALIEAFKAGMTEAHERPTLPPGPNKTTEPYFRRPSEENDD